LQPSKSLGEKKVNSWTETEQHHGNTRRDSPQSTDRCTTISATPYNDVARNRNEQFKNASAQQPARGALNQTLRIIRTRETSKNESPKNPEGGEAN
jgi:hypothetical protein